MIHHHQKLDNSLIKVYTGGSFDCFHAGHVNFLKEAKALGDWLTVALNKDDFMTRFKRQPIHTFEERKIVLESCRYIDEVIPNIGGENSGITIKRVQPNIIAIGDDWKDKDYLGQLGIDQKFLNDLGIYIKYIPYTEGISTTQILERIKND